MVGSPQYWTLEATHQDPSPGFGHVLQVRTSSRGRVASLLNAMTFSLFVNASLDKFGLIDPSTSTVLVGMTLGGTWGFILDNMLGTDEGFREYLWSTSTGMRYAMGALATQRFGRYIVTILFDMFFTVILFKQLYSKLVRLAGFTVDGREWIANGFVSTVISTLTFEVYANMTRFLWAYPSGKESLVNPWISGPTMVLCVVIMNMLYLTSETRSRLGEPGINDPNVKLAVTGFTFAALLGLIQANVIDPSVIDEEYEGIDPNAIGATRISTPVVGGPSAPLYATNWTNTHIPLKGVCLTLHKFPRGAAIFTGISLLCLAFVIFVTSAQSCTGLKAVCPRCCCGRGRKPPSLGAAAKQSSAAMARNPSPVSRENVTVPTRKLDDRMDRLQGQCCLFLLFSLLTFAIVVAFAFIPFYKAEPLKRGEVRDEALWHDACYDYDIDALRQLGLS